MELLPPLRFRFTDADDVAAYGDDWRVWDEQELAGLRGKDLAALEEAVDLPLPAVMRGLRAEKAVPTMAAMWIVLHRAGHPATWDGFNPVVNAANWEAVPLGESPASGEGPTPDLPSSPAPSAESAAS